MASDETNIILPTGHAQALGSYPHAKIVNGFIYLSGTSSRREDNTHEGVEELPDGTVKKDIELQTRAVIRNIEKILGRAGATLHDVVDITTFLVSMEDFAGYNEVYGEFFDAETGPTRTTVAVQALPHPNLLIEIKAVAKVPES